MVSVRDVSIPEWSWTVLRKVLYPRCKRVRVVVLWVKNVKSGRCVVVVWELCGSYTIFYKKRLRKDFWTCFANFSEPRQKKNAQFRKQKCEIKCRNWAGFNAIVESRNDQGMEKNHSTWWEHAWKNPLQSLCKYSNFFNASINFCFFSQIFAQSRADRG